MQLFRRSMGRAAMTGFVVFTCAFLSAAARAQNIGTPLWQALEAVRQGNPSQGQRALLYQNNGLLNNARLNGWMTDAHYQAMQRDYTAITDVLAKKATEMAGAEFRVQTRKGTTFQPGTDSDYIAKLTSKDPVGQIKSIQGHFDDLVNAWREKALTAEGMEYKRYSQWYKKLDVDFMADPSTVSKEQFAAIKAINNGAYERREAAEYERIARRNDGTPVSANQIRGYAQEMLDQIAHKQQQMNELRSKPGYLSDPVARGKLQTLMAQEQKYVERLESTASRVRGQEGLRETMPMRRPEIKVTLKDGVYVFETRETTAAVKGALRAPGNMGTSAVGSSLTRNSAGRAIQDLVDAMAEARATHPQKWPNAAKDIASITAKLTPSEKGAILERLIRKETRGGKAMAKDVAIEMRKQGMGSGASALERLDTGLRRAFGVTEGLSEMGQARQTMNVMAHKTLGAIDKLSKVGVALEVAQAMKEGRDYAYYIAMAMDRTSSDAEANVAFAKAQACANRMALSGVMGVVFTKVPTLGAMYASGKVAYDGTRWLLENTETGQMIDRSVTDFFDRGIQKSEATYDQVVAYFGGQSKGMQDAEQQSKIDKSYLDAFSTGKLKLGPGYTVQLFIAALHANDKALMNKMLAMQTPPVKRTDNQGYVAWTNDVGWIHVGTIESFRKPGAKGGEIWGGLSQQPMSYSVMLGGKSFETFDDAVKAVIGSIGPSIVRKTAALASPSVYYVVGEKMVGFEIINHAACKGYVEAANRRASGSQR